MADKKMTSREFYEAVIKAGVAKELADFAANEIAKLDAHNEKRKNTKTKAQLENEAICDKIIALIKTEGAKVASEIGTALGISTQKASALARELVKGNELTVKDIKVKGKGTVKQYSLGESAVVLGDTEDTAEDGE